VELNREPFAFSELIGRRVYDQSARSLGRVLEVRAHWEADGSIVLDELLVGRAGLWLRLRAAGADRRGIPWAAVTNIEPGRIAIHG
jgi:sporulation protein YlmC with PRC-barrel domain